MDKAIAYGLIDSALRQWRKVTYSELVALAQTNHNQEVIGPGRA